MVEYSWAETIEAAVKWFGTHTFLPPGGIFLDKPVTDEQFHSIMRHIYINKHMTDKEHKKYLHEWAKARQAHQGNLRGSDKMAVGDKITYPGTPGPNKKPRLGEPETISDKVDNALKHPQMQPIMDNSGPKTVEKKPGGLSRKENFDINRKKRDRDFANKLKMTDEEKRREGILRKRVQDRLDNYNRNQRQRFNPNPEEDGQGQPLLGETPGDAEDGEGLGNVDTGDNYLGDENLADEEIAWADWVEQVINNPEHRNPCCEKLCWNKDCQIWQWVRKNDKHCDQFKILPCPRRENLPHPRTEAGKLIIFIYNKNHG